MKKALITLTIGAFIFGSCSKSREDQVKEVCDCFKNEKEPMSCFKMQHDYSVNYEGNERTSFIQETNACAN